MEGVVSARPLCPLSLCSEVQGDAVSSLLALGVQDRGVGFHVTVVDKKMESCELASSCVQFFLTPQASVSLCSFCF